jgi:hypothetical protein
MPRSSQVVNPGAETVSVYVAGGTAWKLKNPLPFDTESRSVCVASFFSTTFASGTTALELSVTTPLNEPVAF